MKSLCLYFFIFFLCFSLSLSKPQSKKFDFSKIINSFIPLSDSNFTQVLFNEKNDFASVVFLTTNDPKHSCNLCRMVESNLNGIIDLYYNQYNGNNDKKVFFFSAEVGTNRNAFMSLQLASVPRVYTISKKTKSSFETLKSKELSASVVTGAFQDLLEDISDNIQVNIKILHDPTLILLGSCFLAIVCAFFMSNFQEKGWSTFLFYRNSKIWCVASMICFAVGVSGSIYCIIKGSVPYSFGQKGDPIIFTADSRDQYFLEGILVSLLVITAGLCFYLLNPLLRLGNLPFPLVRHCLVLIFLSIFLVICEEIFLDYTFKTKWYNLRETVPREIFQFFVSAVKKDSGLFKRMVRLTEIWFSSTVIPPKDFGFKIEQILFDYIKKILFIFGKDGI